MTPGLPGTGIGGLFYILSALLMPFVALVRLLLGRGDGIRWRMIAGQWSIVLGILAALTAEAWLIAWGAASLNPLVQRLIVEYAPHWSHRFAGDLVISSSATDTAVSAAFYVTLSTLLAVLLAVHVLRLVLCSSARARCAPLGTADGAGLTDPYLSSPSEYAPLGRRAEFAEVQ